MAIVQESSKENISDKTVNINTSRVGGISITLYRPLPLGKRSYVLSMHIVLACNVKLNRFSVGWFSLVDQSLKKVWTSYQISKKQGLAVPQFLEESHREKGGDLSQGFAVFT